MKYHRKTVGKHNQKKNGMRKTMKGGGWFWPFTSSTTVNTNDTSNTTSVATTPDTTTPVATTPSKPFSFSEFFGFTKKTDTLPPPTSSITLPPPTSSNTGGYMGGKRRSKTAKKYCAKKGGGK